jgi:hypothetical protein
MERVLEAVEQLRIVRTDYVTTERIFFICEQSTPSALNLKSRDEIMSQSEMNMKAYSEMFNQSEEGVTH